MTRDEIQEIAQECILAARAFWLLDPKWRIYVDVEERDGNLGGCQQQPEYLTARMQLSPQLESPEKVWEVTAHEMAHVALAPLMQAEGLLFNRDEPLPEAFRIGLETVTTTLEHVFLRAHPHKPAK